MLHFGVIGAVLFAAYEIARPAVPEADRVVAIDHHEQKRLATQWEAQWRRPPTAEELERLVDARIQEELLYREALAMGLDRGDAVLRRRLGEKLTIAWADLAALAVPEDAELAAHYAANPDRYRQPAELTLSHRFFSRDTRGQGAETAAAEALEELLAGQAIDDDPFHGAKTLTLPNPQRLVGDFGTTFRDAVLAAAEAGEKAWFGPVRSAYGWHLVRIHRYTTPRQKPLEEVRDEVHLDWQRRQIERDRERRLDALRDAYDVRVAPLPDGPGNPATAVVDPS